MHPEIIQAIAAGQVRELQAQAAMAGRARQLRRSRYAPLFTRFPGPRPWPGPAATAPPAARSQSSLSPSPSHSP